MADGKPGPAKKLCGAQRPNQPKGVTCTQVAGWGTDHLGRGRCCRHGGSTPGQRRKAQREQLQETATRLGCRRDVDPTDAILELVSEAAANVEFYRSLVEGLQAAEGSLYGQLHHHTGEPTGEARRNILVVLYEGERDRLERYCKDALAAGIDERRVALAESQAADLFAAVTEAGKAAKLSPKQQEAFKRALAAALTAHAQARPAPATS